MGAGYGTFKSGIGIAGMGTFRPELMMKVNRLKRLSVDNLDTISLIMCRVWNLHPVDKHEE